MIPQAAKAICFSVQFWKPYVLCLNQPITVFTKWHHYFHQWHCLAARLAESFSHPLDVLQEILFCQDVLSKYIAYNGLLQSSSHKSWNVVQLLLHHQLSGTAHHNLVFSSSSHQHMSLVLMASLHISSLPSFPEDLWFLSSSSAYDSR